MKKLITFFILTTSLSAIAVNSGNTAVSSSTQGQCEFHIQNDLNKLNYSSYLGQMAGANDDKFELIDDQTLFTIEEELRNIMSSKGYVETKVVEQSDHNRILLDIGWDVFGDFKHTQSTAATVSFQRSRKMYAHGVYNGKNYYISYTNIKSANSGPGILSGLTGGERSPSEVTAKALKQVDKALQKFKRIFPNCYTK